MKYKVGDRVRIKSFDWYNENKDEDGKISINEDFTFYADRNRYCGKVFTISEVFDNYYGVKEDNNEYYWTDEMVEGLAEEENKDMGEELRKCKSDFEYWVDNYIILPDGYVFKDENGNLIYANKIILEKKKKEYPKTYKECCLILGIPVAPLNPLKITNKSSQYEKHLGSLIEDFIHLRTCRDAYWKIAGEEMRLGKPWKPDYDSGVDKFGIICMDGVVQESNPTTNWERHLNKILDFPTREMRDAFYENFKELIEQCKELL